MKFRVDKVVLTQFEDEWGELYTRTGYYTAICTRLDTDDISWEFDFKEG